MAPSVRDGDLALKTIDHFIYNLIKQYFKSMSCVSGTKLATKDARMSKSQSPFPRRSKFMKEGRVSHL